MEAENASDFVVSFSLPHSLTHSLSMDWFVWEQETLCRFAIVKFELARILRNLDP